MEFLMYIYLYIYSVILIIDTQYTYIPTSTDQLLKSFFRIHGTSKRIKPSKSQFRKNHFAVAKLVEYSAPDRKTRVRGSPGEKPPCTLMASSACKIRRECNVLQVPIQIIPLGVPKRGRHPLCGGSKL